MTITGWGVLLTHIPDYAGGHSRPLKPPYEHIPRAPPGLLQRLAEVEKLEGKDRAWGFGGLGFRGLGVRSLGFRFWVKGFGGLGLRFKGLGFRVCLGFQGLVGGFRD